MIGKIIGHRAAFAPTLRYILGKNLAQLIDANGVCTESIEQIATGFDLQASLRPTVSKPAKHLVLSFHKSDKEQLSNERMVEIARCYLSEMGYRPESVQYVLSRHFDNGIPHCHLLLNRIDHNGMPICEDFEKSRNVRVCQMLSEQYGLHIAEGKQQIRAERLRGQDKIRYSLYLSISESLKSAHSWQAFSAKLSAKGIRLEFKHKGTTKIVEGVKFVWGDLSFSGSKIDRSLSYARICKTLAQNRSVAPTQQPIRPLTHRTEPDLTHLLRRFGAAMGPTTPTDYTPDDEEEEKENLKHPYRHDL